MLICAHTLATGPTADSCERERFAQQTLGTFALIAVGLALAAVALLRLQA
jgi:hypothetical protein